GWNFLTLITDSYKDERLTSPDRSCTRNAIRTPVRLRAQTSATERIRGGRGRAPGNRDVARLLRSASARARLSPLFPFPRRVRLLTARQRSAGRPRRFGGNDLQIVYER